MEKENPLRLPRTRASVLNGPPLKQGDKAKNRSEAELRTKEAFEAIGKFCTVTGGKNCKNYTNLRIGGTGKDEQGGTCCARYDWV